MAVPLAIKIRAKKLGVLLRDARQSAGKTKTECADAIGVTSYRIASYEKGENSPSLPEVESLAFYLDVNLGHFWGDESISSQERYQQAGVDKLLPLRQKIIGAKLRKARQDADIPLTDLAEQVGLSSYMLRSYERGERPIPLPDLELLLQITDVSLDEFRDLSGPVGVWASQQELIEKFLALSPELQEFVTLPINMPYLEVAQRLSKLSTDQIRAVAEGLLDITL